MTAHKNSASMCEFISGGNEFISSIHQSKARHLMFAHLLCNF